MDFQTKILDTLLASGPLAAVLAFALLKVWNAYQEALKESKALQEKVLDILKNALREEGK